MSVATAQAPSEAAVATLRRLPTPMTEPPFEDELVDDRERVAPLAVLREVGGQRALALPFRLPGDVPAIPAVPVVPAPQRPPLRLVDPPHRSDDATRASRNVADFGPQPTPRAQLPEPSPWAGRLVQAIVEVTAGRRPAAQLIRWTTTTVFDAISARNLAARRALATGATARRVAPVVRSVHVFEPRDGVAEVSAVVTQDQRCRAIALRLEGVDGRWQCTALQFG
jgi:hypothetical protein